MDVDTDDHGGVLVSTGGEDRDGRRRRGGLLWWVGRLVPGFFYVLIIYAVGKYFIADPRAAFLDLANFQLSWVETLQLIATMVALFELLRVSKPGIDNTIEALSMGVIFGVQLVLFAVGATNDGWMHTWFANTEFLMLMVVSGVQMAVAFLINARTLKRTIDHGGM